MKSFLKNKIQNMKGVWQKDILDYALMKKMSSRNEFLLV